tara:strand:- start:541 stop:1122 length:582 start_codon:yes stop_codon:yes gene_type:complete
MGLDRLSGFGFQVDNSQTIKALNDFAQNIVVPYMRNLTKSKAYDKGGLYQSIRSEVVEGGGNTGIGAGEYSINIVIDDPGSSYFNFVDKGVKGTESSLKAPNSPYRFGTGTGPRGGLTRSITEWSQRKGLYKYRFGIIKNIYKYGLKTRPILDPTFDYAQKLIETSYEERLEQGFADDMNLIIENLITEINNN